MNHRHASACPRQERRRRRRHRRRHVGHRGRWPKNSYRFLSVQSDDGSVGGVGDRGVSDDSGCGSDDMCSGDDRRGLNDRRGVGNRGGGDQRALHGDLVGVGVAGGDRHTVGNRDWRGDDRRCVEGGGREVAWCSRGAGQQGEESDELVHGCLRGGERGNERIGNWLTSCLGAAEERVMPEQAV